ncbi:MAG: hypothetical protein ABR905_09965 [Terracidiphilus sp.]|jgi:hypothetical protein
MRFIAKVATISALFALMLVCGFAREPTQCPKADIIVTATPAYEPLAALRGEERFPKGAQLLSVHVGKAEPLITGFAATADANVSFDAQTVFFAGKKTADDPWQIWELTLVDHSLRKIVADANDAIRPLYLPGGRLVYAHRTDKGYRLEAAQLDGSAVQPLSFLQASAIPESVLKDGRILFEAGFPLGSGSTPELFLVYSDGSGVESYRCDHGSARWGGTQLASGDLVFTHGATLARFTSPLAAEQPIVAPRADYAGAIAETANGAWLMSARAGAGTRYALKLWKPGAAALQTLLAQSGEDIVEPVLVAARTTSKRHPSGLHDWSYANLMALDARQSREGNLRVAPASVRLETQDAQGHAVVTGTAPVETDGSFYVQTPADKPIRFALLDEKGAVLLQEHGWFWIRRGEQRYCTGCHAGPERTPENRLPAVLLLTTTPADLTGLREPRDAQHAKPGGN